MKLELLSTAAAILVLATACSTSEPLVLGTQQTAPAATEEPLEQAKATWAEADISSYEIVATESINHHSSGCTWTTVVEDGEIVSSESSDEDRCADGYTVDSLHEMIDNMKEKYDSEELDPSANVLRVEYDDSGVPMSIEYDLFDWYDEQQMFDITFTPTV